MRAAVLHPGGGLTMEDRPAPSPGPGQILVAPRLVGICGSDLHYYQDGRIGDWRILRPHVLGHEFTGVVAEVGPQVDSAAVGDRIAVEPIIPCGGCGACRRGLYNVCPHIRFTGSPHTDGALQELVAVPARGGAPSARRDAVDARRLGRTHIHRGACGPPERAPSGRNGHDHRGGAHWSADPGGGAGLRRRRGLLHRPRPEPSGHRGGAGRRRDGRRGRAGSRRDTGAHRAVGGGCRLRGGGKPRHAGDGPAGGPAGRKGGGGGAST